jgi:hypothetical protein
MTSLTGLVRYFSASNELEGKKSSAWVGLGADWPMFRFGRGCGNGFVGLGVDGVVFSSAGSWGRLSL